MFNDKAFRGYIDRKGLKLQTVAKAMGMSPVTLYKKRRGDSDFTLGEIQKFCLFCEGVNMNMELCVIFFGDKVA